MTTVYISSTYNDLKDYREAVYRALHKLKHTVISMEDYVAADQRPLKKCLDDVARCEIYIGIFAWRYGYIPEKDNPEKKSITDLEFRKATELGKPRLIFLLKDDASWPANLMDGMTPSGDGHRIQYLRDELRKEFITTFFSSPDDLALNVSIALNLELATEQLRKLDLGENLADLEQTITVGGSQVSEIELKIKAAVDAKDVGQGQMIELDLGFGESWWSTRLYLLASLAADFTTIQQFVFVDEHRNFIGMISPLRLSRALVTANRDLHLHYKPEVGWTEEGSVILTARSFLESFKPGEEEKLKEWVMKDSLKTWLGTYLSEISVSVQSTNYQKTSLLLHQVIDCPADFVAIVTKQGKLLDAINRNRLAVNLAETVLRKEIES
jgi:hypothetical protein